MESVNVELIAFLLLVVLAALAFTLVRIGVILWKLLFGPRNRPYPEEEGLGKEDLEQHPYTEPE